MPLVIDASVALSWCFADEHSDYADRVLHRLAEDEAVAPAIWALELANGMLVAMRRGRLTAAEVSQVCQLILDLPITLEDLTLERGLGGVLQLADAQALTAYDAAYLDLAMREALPLAALDDDLRAAATRVGVQLWG
jgi:predicted nucleic acid-binding protein